MKKIWLTICISLFLIQPCFAQVVVHLENYYKLKESAVSVIIQYKDKQDVEGICSGIIITEDENFTGILTAKHCVDDKNIKRVIINYKYIVNSIVKANNIDVAYLEISTSLLRYNPIYISQSNVKYYDYVYFLGYSKKQIFELGLLIFGTGNNQYAILRSIGGCSGAGIINQKGELVGILWGGGEINWFNQKLEMSVFTPIEKIKPFLIKLKIWNKLRVK